MTRLGTTEEVVGKQACDATKNKRTLSTGMAVWMRLEIDRSYHHAFMPRSADMLIPQILATSGWTGSDH